jgi:hypothetical protein
MNTYRPSPALDLREFIAQEEVRLSALGWKVLPLGALIMLTAVPPNWDWPVARNPEERLRNLLDMRDVLDQQSAIIEEEITLLQLHIAAKINPVC